MASSSSSSPERDPDWIPCIERFDPNTITAIRYKIKEWEKNARKLRRRNNAVNWEDPDEALFLSDPMEKFVRKDMGKHASIIPLNDYHLPLSNIGGLNMKYDLNFFLINDPDNPHFQCAVTVEEQLYDATEETITTTASLLLAGEEYYLFRALWTGCWNHNDGIQYRRIRLKAGKGKEPAAFTRLKNILANNRKELVQEMDSELRRQVEMLRRRRT